MTRAHGRHTQRAPELSPEQRREFGIDDRDIPGGLTHIQNYQVAQQKVPVAEPLEQFRGMMAHGVPPEEYGVYDREHKVTRAVIENTALREPPVPVPVYIVEPAAGGLLHATTRHFQAPAIGQEPESICGQDRNRRSVRLLNEGVTSGAGCRFGQLNDLAWDSQNNLIVGGAFLPNAMTSYLKIETQGPLYIVSMDSHIPYISVIIETEIAGAA